MEGINISIPFTLQDNYHLWTIQDAKDGDVLAQNWHVGDDYMENIIIFKKYHNKGVEGLVNAPCVEGYGNTFRNGKPISRKRLPHYSKTWTANFHPATKEEKQKLFQVIKEHGYECNNETNTSEELVKPIFKVGDRIIQKNGVSVPILITKVSDEFYYTNTESSVGVLPISKQDDWVLVPDKLIEHKFNVGDIIQDSDGYKVEITKVNIDEKYYEYQIIEYLSMISIGIGIIHFDNQDEWELVPNKFDITTLVPFESRVLVRDCNSHEWEGEIFVRYADKSFNNCNFVTLGGLCWKQCIPYNDDTKHLLGKTDNCDEFYKTWSNE